MIKNFLKIFSYILHPVFIPSMATGCYFLIAKGFFTDFEIQLSLFHSVLLTLLLPICIYFLLRSMKLISSSIMVEKREERATPIFLNIILIGILVFFIWKYNRGYDLKHFFVTYMISYGLAFTSVLAKKKYSIHLLSFSAAALFIIKTSIDYHQPIIISLSLLVLLLGCLMSSRIAIKAHTFLELFMGILIGILPQLVLWNTVLPL